MGNISRCKLEKSGYEYFFIITSPNISARSTTSLPISLVFYYFVFDFDTAGSSPSSAAYDSRLLSLFALLSTSCPKNAGDDMWMMAIHSVLNRWCCARWQQLPLSLTNWKEWDAWGAFNSYLLSRAPASPRSKTPSSHTWLGSTVPAGAYRTVGPGVYFTLEFICWKCLISNVCILNSTQDISSAFHHA